MSTETAVQPQLVPITINGELKDVPANLSVEELLEWLGVAIDRVAVELNRSIVRKRDWQQAVVTAGSHLEIVEFVGGG
ncbi:MAG TPA: sulfur carrier protein ThiS [Bryobacteraceae bacterium]|nr:sulfur carrier protein ThiS [Bryobacteraceae bacterium]